MEVNNSPKVLLVSASVRVAQDRLLLAACLDGTEEL